MDHRRFWFGVAICLGLMSLLVLQMDRHAGQGINEADKMPGEESIETVGAEGYHKQRSTIYTPEKVAAARQNVAAYRWARTMKDVAVIQAKKYTRMTPEQLWNLIPPPALPRSYAVNEEIGSPVTGKDIDRYGAYPYQADPIAAPWKLVDPSSGYTFPTNDFAAYYVSGLDDSGLFRPELADRTLLVNTLYPEKGADWGVDDGFGWVDEAGNRFTFIAYYVHRFIWYGERKAVIPEALQALRDAYLYTGEMEYARAGMILLDRIADVYPEMDTSLFDRTIYLHNGEEGKGKAVGAIWETLSVQDYLTAYDAFHPVMDDAETIQFLSGQAEKFGLANPKQSGADLRRNIEEGIVKQVYPAVKNGQILGNTGMHQSALALAAVVYDSMPETGEWLDFVFQPGGALYGPARVIGGDLLPILVNTVDRDGQGDEASPSYNAIWLRQFRLVADILQGYDRYASADLYQNVKFKKMFDAFYPLVMSGQFTPSIGDSGTTGQGGVVLELDDMVKAYQVYGDPIYAQWAYILNGNKAAGIHGGIFDPDPEAIAQHIQDVIEQHGTLRPQSVHMTGYGLTALRAGSSLGQSHNVWMLYGRTTGHGHRDALHLELFSYGRNLTPDLGYPEYTDYRDMHRFHWVRNTVSHNTVVVDRSQQEGQWVGLPHHYDDTPYVKLMDISAPDVYKQTEVYRRTTAMIHIEEDQWYAVDLFRVRGGSEHHFSFHGFTGSAVTEGLTLTAQAEGTYAGTDVAYGQRVDSVEGTGYMGSGFHYLRNVERDSLPPSRFMVEWGNENTHVRLRMTMLGQWDEVALADGIPPQNKPGNPPSLRYIIAHRESENNERLDSLFTSVLEAYREHPQVRAIESLPVRLMGGDGDDAGPGAAALRVELTSGRVDTLFYALDPDQAYLVDDRFVFQGFLAVYAEQDRQPLFTYMQDGTLLRLIDQTRPIVERSSRALEATVVDFTRELQFENEIILRSEEHMSNEGLVGQYIYIENDGKRNAVYPIQAVHSLGNQQYRILIGDATLIRQFADDQDMTKGYVYDIAAGARVVIPLSTLLVHD